MGEKSVFPVFGVGPVFSLSPDCSVTGCSVVKDSLITGFFPVAISNKSSSSLFTFSASPTSLANSISATISLTASVASLDPV